MRKILFFLLLALNLSQHTLSQEPNEKKLENLINEILEKVEKLYSLEEEALSKEQIQEQIEIRRQLERIRKQLENIQKHKEIADTGNFREELRRIQNEAIEIQKKTQELIEKLKEKPKNHVPFSPIFRFNGNTLIAKNDFIEGNILVKDGDLIVYGRIKGDILVENGDVIIKKDAEVVGNIYTTNGKIKISKDAKFVGQKHENFSLLAEIDQEISYERRKHRIETKLKEFYEEQPGIDNFYFEFERVSGFKIGLIFPRKYTSTIRKSISAYGYGGYATKSHRWIFSVGIDRTFINTAETSQNLFLLIFGGKIFSTIGTKDNWLIPPNANTLSALIWNNDYRDYFKHEGFEVYLDTYFEAISSALELQNLKITYSNANYASETTKYIRFFKWNKKRPFRNNPPIYDGNLKTLSMSYRTIRFETIEGFKRSGYGLYLDFEREIGNFKYNILSAEIRFRLSISRYDNFGFRFKVASSDMKLPKQKSFELGGFGTLHGFPYKSFEGNKMFLLNTEYILSNPFDMFDFVNFFVFFDAGYVDNLEGKIISGFKIKNIKEIKSDFGFGFGTESMKTRIYFAWRTDIKAPPIIVLRLSDLF